MSIIVKIFYPNSKLRLNQPEDLIFENRKLLLVIIIIEIGSAILT